MFRLGLSQRRWWDFLITMTEREIKSKYKLSLLGVFWIVLNPIIQMVVIGFIFKFFTLLRTENYLLYLFSGLVVWNFFSSSVSRSTPAVVNERFLLKKAIFPRETIVIAIILSNFVQLLISILLMVPMIFMTGIKINLLALWYLPICLISLLLFTLGCCLIFASLNVKYRDTNFAINFLMSIWFYATPVIYVLAMLPNKVSRWLYLNPMTGLLEFFRWSVLGWRVENWSLVIGDIVVGLVIFGVGSYFFNKMSLDFDDWI